MVAQPLVRIGEIDAVGERNTRVRVVYDFVRQTYEKLIKM